MSSLLNVVAHSTGAHPLIESTSRRGGRWLEVLSHIHPRYGGLSAAVPALSTHLRGSSGMDISLAAFCANDEHFNPENLSSGRLTFWPASRMSWLSPFHTSTLGQDFEALLAQSSGVHIHGLWEASTAVAAAAARRIGVPYILSAHGMLEPWALRSGRWKKRLYGAAIERHNVADASCLHALTLTEAKQYIRFGARSPVAVIPNGVDIPTRRDPSLFLAAHPELRGKRIVLFLGRLHAKKGLDLLLNSWAAVASSWPGSHLVIAGPDSNGMQAKFEQFVTQHMLQQSVSFVGMLQDELKWSSLAAAECFVLPSHSEGLSVSVLEAMGMGLPVIVTDACNMPQVAEVRAGWQIVPTAGALTSALSELLGNDPGANRFIGARGSRLIADAYTWPVIASRMAELYRWVEGGSTPESVTLVHP